MNSWINRLIKGKYNQNEAKVFVVVLGDNPHTAYDFLIENVIPLVMNE